MSRLRADTMPAVTVPPRPNGFPTASTQSPTRGYLSDIFTKGNFFPFPSVTLMSARSVRGSDPIIFASNFSPSSIVTVMSSASSTTWLLVTTNPSSEMKKPDPCARLGMRLDGPLGCPLKNFSKKSRGMPSGRFGIPGMGESSLDAVLVSPLTLMLTTAGFTFCTRSANDSGARP